MLPVDGDKDREVFLRGTRKHLGLMKTVITLILVMVSQVYTYDKIDQTINFECVHFIVCPLYFNKIYTH